MNITIETQSRAAVNAVQWDRWMARHGAADYQHYAGYGAVMEQTRAVAAYTRFTMSGQDVARAVMLTQQLGPLKITHVPRGLVFADSSAMPAVFAVLRALGSGWRGRFVLISPPDAAQADAIRRPPIMTGETDAILAIAPSDAEQQAQMHQKWRNRLCKAQRSDLEVRQVKPGHPLAAWLMEQEGAQRHSKGYRGLPASFPADMAGQKGKADSLFCIAMCADRPVSGASFVISGRHAAYFSGVTTPQGRDVCAQHLVLSHGAAHLRARQVSAVNLGLLDTVKSQGLSRFKLGTGATAQARPGLFLVA